MERLAAAAALVVGLAGWSTIGSLHVTDWTLFICAFAIGLVAGLIARRPIGLLSLCIGIGASYFVSRALGSYLYLGDSWQFYLVLFLLVAALGYVAGGLLRDPVAHRLASRLPSR